MSDFRKAYIRDAVKCLTPVYIPGESYSFVINAAEYFSDPQWQTLDLQIVDAATNGVVKTNVAQLSRVFPYAELSPLYQIYCTFPFPELPNGQYCFAIYQYSTDEMKLRSNVILVENEILNTTSFVEFWDFVSKFGIAWSAINRFPELGIFRQRFRLPISQSDLQYESDRKTYRNVTDRRLRVVKSYRDTNVKLDAIGFDEPAHEALSAMLEHSNIEIGGVPIESRSALTINTNAATELNKSSFEGYADPENRNGIFKECGDVLILCGDASHNPPRIIHP